MKTNLILGRIRLTLEETLDLMEILHQTNKQDMCEDSKRIFQSIDKKVNKLYQSQWK